jgi:hypothetical protein
LTVPPATRTAWTARLDPDRRSAAVDTAREVVRRSSDPARIAAVLARGGGLDEHWNAVGIARGDAGIAVLAGYADRCLPGEGWDAVGHEFLTRAVRAAERRPPPPGLYAGLAGVAFAASQLSRDGTRYRTLAAELDAAVVGSAAPVARRLTEPGTLGVGDVDLLSGAVGLAVHALREPRGRPAEQLLAGLVAVVLADADPPRWATPPQSMDARSRAMFPTGNLNCGLAHGLPGILAVLALAAQAGAEVPRLAEALRAGAGWLLDHGRADEWGVNWPAAVPLPPTGPEAVPPARAGWCYGSPGVSRALWLAGRALGDPALRELAVEAMGAVLRRPADERRVPSPTFCHGVAGLLQVVLRFAADTGLPVFDRAAVELTDTLLAAYDPDRPLGYRTLDPAGAPIDRAGLLDGAPGVALVLLAAATDVEPSWDRLFLLS